MDIKDAQREMRSAFLGGFAGQLPAGLIWAAAVVLVVFGILGRGLVLREERAGR